jgi:hypothetical protein
MRGLMSGLGIRMQGAVALIWLAVQALLRCDLAATAIRVDLG